MLKQSALIAFLAFVFTITLSRASGEIIMTTQPLVAGSGYNTYRIPGFIVAMDGSLLLFAEGRPNSADPGGPGDIDMVYKRSTDGGLTWSSLIVLKEANGFDYSDPRVLIDEASSKVHLHYVQWPTNNGQAGVPPGLGDNTSVAYYQSSPDNGTTWTAPVNINAAVKVPTWNSLNSGPGKGIQLQWQDAAPSRNGRLIVPAHMKPPAYSGISIYSDDNGVSWTRGTSVTPGFSDEAEVIELTNGDLMWDGRQSGGSSRNRFRSTDGGLTWTSAAPSGLPVTPVDTGILRFSASRNGDDRDRILYSCPLGSNQGTGNSRDNIGVWTSYDEGKSYINPVRIQSGSGAYSVIDKMSNGTLGLVYEVNHNTIRFVNFDLAELEGPAQSANLTHYDGFGNTIQRFNGGIGWSGPWLGNGTFANDPRAEFGNSSSISFDVFRFDRAPGRLDLDGSNDGAVSRKFAKPIDLNSSSVAYFSLLVSQELDASNNDSGGEFLDVLLKDGSGNIQAAFGCGSNEGFFVNNLGSTVATSAGSLQRTGSYFLVAKIISQDDSQGGNFDQIFMKVFASGTDSIPDTDAGMDWTLVGTTNENSSGLLETLELDGGDNVYWSLDEIRIGSTWEAVTFNISSHIFYSGSSFESGGVDAALDTTKSLAQQGTEPRTLGFDNIINTSLGITGVVLDIDSLTATSLTNADFEFRMSPQGLFDENSNPPTGWEFAPPPSSINVIAGSTPRVVVTWPASGNPLVNRWLRIAVQANSRTGLIEPAIFYLGHVLGETTGVDGNGTYAMTFSDLSSIRSQVGQTVDAGSMHDIDKGGTVNFQDISLARENVSTSLTNITVP